MKGKKEEEKGNENGDVKAGEKLKTKEYDKELAKLHVELVKLQEWVKFKRLKVCVVFEGRDGAGKGGVIKAITERVSPRVFRVVALPAPTDREQTQIYAQRYVPHLPAAGEVVIFDRSWYNRAGVERVMGFCTKEQAMLFLDVVPLFEKLDVSMTAARSGNSLRWTSSPTADGTTTPRRATRCSQRAIRHGRRGTWQNQTTKSGRG